MIDDDTPQGPMQTDRQTDRWTHRESNTDSRSMDIPESSFLTVKYFAFQLITLLVNSTINQSINQLMYQIVSTI